MALIHYVSDILNGRELRLLGIRAVSNMAEEIRDAVCNWWEYNSTYIQCHFQTMTEVNSCAYPKAWGVSHLFSTLAISLIHHWVLNHRMWGTGIHVESAFFLSSKWNDHHLPLLEQSRHYTYQLLSCFLLTVFFYISLMMTITFSLIILSAWGLNLLLHYEIGTKSACLNFSYSYQIGWSCLRQRT